MKPTIGRIVNYFPKEDEKKAFDDSTTANNSEVLPAVIVAVWSDTCVNLRVIADGKPENDIWATSSNQGTASGNWAWPERV